MRGYPKHLNSRTDYDYVLKNFKKDEYAKDFQALLDSQWIWVKGEKLDDPAKGVKDATHQVIPDGDDENPVYYQAELQYNPNCKMAQLGYTADEVLKILEG